MKSCISTICLVALCWAFGHTLQAQVHADFSIHTLVDPDCVPLSAPRHMIAKSSCTGNIQNWIWQSNSKAVIIEPSVPSAPSISINPSAGPIPESIQLTLIAVGANSSDTVTKTVPIGFHFAPLPNPRPRHQVEGCAPFQIEFENGASSVHGSAITAYSWTFGEESASSNQATHTYTYQTPGTFTAKLVVTDETGCTGGNHWEDTKIKVVVKPSGTCN